MSDEAKDGALLGRLEVPAEGVVVVSDGILSLRGWVAHPRLPIRAVWAWSGDVRVPLGYGLPRLDVEWDRPGTPSVSRSGFVGRVPVPRVATRVELEIWVELGGGQRVRWEQRTLELVHEEGPEGPIELPGSLTFHLETPAPGTAAAAAIAVRGWIVCHRAVVRRIWATTDDGACFPLRHGVLRPDVVEGRNLHFAPLRGFEGVVVLPPSQREVQLCFWAELDTGETILIMTRSILAREPLATVTTSASAQQRWRQTNRVTPRLGSALADRARAEEGVRPLVSFLYAADDEPALATIVESLRGQLDPRWELCVAFDGRSRTAGTMLRETSFPPRVRSIGLPGLGSRVRALNAALDLATADFVAIVGPRGSLTPDAVCQIGAELGPHLDWLYTDHDEIDGRPVLKSAWDPERALAAGFPGRLSVIRREWLNRIGRLRREHEGAEEWDLHLRLAEQVPAERIGHLARVCYREPREVPSREAAARALSEALRRRALPATVAAGDDVQPRWEPSVLARNPVSIVIPTRDRVDLLRGCIESLRRTVDERYVQLLIVDDDSSEPATLDYLGSLRAGPRFGCRVVRVAGPREGFDYARLMNGALAHVQTPLMLHLNNDVRAQDPGWLEEMVGWLAVPGVGVVGATLIGEDGVVRHAGVVVGPHGGLADHAFAGLTTTELDGRDDARVPRDVSAVTGACLLIRTELYRTLGGFDAQRFRVDYNDVDLCLRAAAEGYRTVVIPRARLIHAGGASRGASFDPGEHLSFIERHSGIRDRFVNDNVSLDSTDLQPDPHRYVHAEDCRTPLRLLVLIEGAAHPAACERLVRAARREHEVVVITTKVPDPSGALGSTSAELRAVGEALRLERFDLVIGHGLASYRAIGLAAAWRKPSLWHIPDEALLSSGEEEVMAAMRRATRVCFASRSMALLFANENDRDHHRLIEGGAQWSAIREFLQTFGQRDGHRALRDMLKLDANEVAIAVAAETANPAWMEALMAATCEGGRKVRWLPLGGERRRGFQTLGAADLLFVPDVVGVPTVCFDAMALGVPLVAPRTTANAEVVCSGAEGLLFAPADAADAAAALRRLVDDPDLRREIGRNAMTKARRLFDGDRATLRMLRLIREAALV